MIDIQFILLILHLLDRITFLCKALVYFIQELKSSESESVYCSNVINTN